MSNKLFLLFIHKSQTNGECPIAYTFIVKYRPTQFEKISYAYAKRAAADDYDNDDDTSMKNDDDDDDGKVSNYEHTFASMSCHRGCTLSSVGLKNFQTELFSLLSALLSN